MRDDPISDPCGVKAFRSCVAWDRLNGAVGILLDTVRQLAWLQTGSQLEYCTHADSVEINRQALADMTGADDATVDRWVAWSIDGVDAVVGQLIPELHGRVQSQLNSANRRTDQ